MCEQQYFIEYVLGHRSPSNKKADKGTIVHKVLEILAVMKQASQNKEKIIVDDIFGEINLSKQDMFDAIFIHELIDKIYEYYTSQFTHHEWEIKDKKDCIKWVNQALTYNNRMFDPRHRHIVQPEQKFDIIINKPWAKYEFDTKDGKLEGNLGIKGTIDLITKIQDDTFEIIDWKTGRRLDWATGQEKTFAKLQQDPQLRMYHYAVSILYPEIDHIIVSINFINDGGAFSVCFDKSDLAQTEDMLRQKFEIIKSTQKPRLNKTWKCNKLCHFGKTSFDNGLIEYRNGMKTNIGEAMCKCEQIKHDTDLHGLNFVVDKYTHAKHNVSKYKEPGSVE